MKVEFALQRDELKNISGFLNSLVDEVKLRFGSDGVIVEAVDPAHVAMEVLKIDRSRFAEWKVDLSDFQPPEPEPNPEAEKIEELRQVLNEGAVTVAEGQVPYAVIPAPVPVFEVGLDLDELKTIFKVGDKKSIIRLEADSEKKTWTARYPLVKGSPVLGEMQFNRTDTAGFLDPKVPTIFLEGEFAIGVKEFEAALKVLKDITDTVVFVAEHGQVKICGEGAVTSMEIPLPEANYVNHRTGNGELVKAIYPLDYLNGMVKGLKPWKAVKFRFGTDFPCEITAQTGEGMTAKYILAPRIES